MSTKTIVPCVLIDRRGLEEFGIRFCRQHLNRLIKRGAFPSPIFLGPKKRAWKKSEIEQWVASRPASF